MDLQKMLKQAQGLQNQMQKTQAEMAQRSFESSVAGGKIRITANGHGHVTAVNLAAEVLDPSDVELLQDLLLSAIQQAQQQAQQHQSQEMGKLTGGMGLPPGFGL
jgi:nucleoid-associated protein EbfC